MLGGYGQPGFRPQGIPADGGGFGGGTGGGDAWQPMPAGAGPPPTDIKLNSISQEFSYKELADGTEQFSAGSRLGEGTYGTVYRGTLRDATEVAIKTLASPKEGGFREEVDVLSRFRHPNLVILIGFARNGRERYLVYEFLSGGDLYTRVAKDATFKWKQRLSVSLDTALGLSHLHGSRPQVFHRDVKTQNILLDRNGTGKVADFGLACLAQPNQRSLMVSQTSGTVGYADPLYIRTGRITEQSEVYSMGMVLLEVLTGRPPALQHPNGRIEYQFEHLGGDLQRLNRMVDSRGEWPTAIVELLGELSLRSTCAQEQRRPSFVDIVKNLRTWLRDESLHQAAAPAPAPAAQDPRPGGVAQQHMPREQAPLQGVNINGPGGPAAAAAAAQAALRAGAGAGYQAPQSPSPWPQQAANPYARAAHPIQQKPLNQPIAAGAAAAAQPSALDRRQSAGGAPTPLQQAQHLQQHLQQQMMRGAVAQAPVPAAPAYGGACGGANATGTPQANASATSAGDREADIQKVKELGFTREQAIEAFKRCSSVEAAVEYILSNEL